MVHVRRRRSHVPLIESCLWPVSLRRARKPNSVILMLLVGAAIAASLALTQIPATAKQQGANGQADRVQRANAAYDKKNFEEALALYQEILRTAPPEYLAENETRIHRALGACYAQLSRHQEAIAEFNKSNSIHEEADNFAWLGLVHDNTRDYSAGERNWRRAVELAPDNPDFSAGLAYAASHFGDYDAAQRAIDRARERASTVEARQTLQQSQMIVFLGRGRYSDAYQLANREKRIYVEGENVSGGVRIGDAYMGGPAQLAGLERGDIIVSFNGESIPDNAALSAALDRAQFGATVSVRVNRNGVVLDRSLIVGVQPNLPELTTAANTKDFSAGRTAQPAPAADRPVLGINRVVVNPSVVAAGEQFTVEVSYTTRSMGTVTFTASIHAGGQKLFESRPRSFEAAGNEAELFTSRIAAANEPGKYTIRVHLTFGDAAAEGEATLTVTPRK